MSRNHFRGAFLASARSILKRRHHCVGFPRDWVKSMLIREKSKQDCPDAPAENRNMVSAIFGAVADFAEPAEQKLKAVIRAGQIAEAFLVGANAGTSPLARDDEALRGNGSEGKRGLAGRAA
jgi:hypothetical protein